MEKIKKVPRDGGILTKPMRFRFEEIVNIKFSKFTNHEKKRGGG